MAKKKGNVYGAVVLYEKKHNRTSIGGGRVKTSTMNKSKRRSYKKYKGQGKWQSDQCSILMESSYLIKCHKIIDHHKIEGHVETVGCSHKSICFVVSLELKESEILMSATSGDQEELKDNGTYYP